MRLGVFGGTFNPVHYGHLRAAEEAREMLRLDRVLFVPAGNPPLKSSGLAPAPDRLRMAELAVAGNPCFEVSDVECRTGEVSYTVNTLHRLGASHPEAALFFILGIDAFMDMPHWRQPEKLAAMADFAILGRPPREFSEVLSSPFVETGAMEEETEGGLQSLPLKGGRRAFLLGITPLDISATAIREAVGRGGSVKYLLPEKVESFIITHGLYSGK
ncbi:MAG: nicotinate-nucleotide adenylyltransferase [Thermodesulfovibrionales bacterium]